MILKQLYEVRIQLGITVPKRWTARFVGSQPTREDILEVFRFQRPSMTANSEDDMMYQFIQEYWTGLGRYECRRFGVLIGTILGLETETAWRTD